MRGDPQMRQSMQAERDLEDGTRLGVESGCELDEQ